MVRGRCPDCDVLVEITPTNRPKMPGFSSSWWRVEDHGHPEFDDDPLSYRSRIVFVRCEGSGKLV